MGMRKVSKYYLSKGQKIWIETLYFRHGNKGGENEPVLAQNDWDTDGLRWAQDDWATCPSTPETPPPYPHEEFNDPPELEEVEEEPHPMLMIVNHTKENSKEENEESDDE